MRNAVWLAVGAASIVTGLARAAPVDVDAPPLPDGVSGVWHGVNPTTVMGPMYVFVRLTQAARLTHTLRPLHPHPHTLGSWSRTFTLSPTKKRSAPRFLLDRHHKRPRTQFTHHCCISRKHQRTACQSRLHKSSRNVNNALKTSAHPCTVHTTPCHPIRTSECAFIPICSKLSADSHQTPTRIDNAKVHQRVLCGAAPQ